MAMNLMRAGSIGGVAVLLLAAVGCTVETSLGEEDGEIESTTEALGCDTSLYVGVCQSQCYGCGGATIGFCMSACIGGYCAQQMPFTPDSRCTIDPDWRVPVWMPAPPTTPLRPDDDCQSDVLMSCKTRCDLCNYPTTEDRGACQRTCTATWCTVGDLTSCYRANRYTCENNFCKAKTGDDLYTCLADCLSVCQDAP
jgi:hypothetical protein